MRQIPVCVIPLVIRGITILPHATRSQADLSHAIHMCQIILWKGLTQFLTSPLSIQSAKAMQSCFSWDRAFTRPLGKVSFPWMKDATFNPLFCMERKALTTKQTAQESPALHKVEAANPTAHTGASAEQPSPPIRVNSLCKGLGLQPSVTADAMCLPLPPPPHV